jgi:phytoene desaturase
MRTVKGPKEKIVIVGAGLAGLSAAIRLIGAGRDVTILERESVPGGRNGLLEKSGYSFDTGPTVLTMPSLIEDVLSTVGENMNDWLELMPLRPLYRAFYSDGSTLDVHSNTEEMEAEIARVVGGDEANGYRKYVEFVTKLYKYEMNDFIDKNIDSPLDLLTPNLARLIAIGGFRKLAPKVSQFLKDPRTQRIYSFQAMYAGVSPQQALAIYAVIAYMDAVNGVFFPKGGMHAVPRALANVAVKHGAKIFYNSKVTKLEKKGNRVVAAITEDGSRYECDAIILNPDLPIAYTELLEKPLKRIKKLDYSPSCAVLLVGSKKNYSHIAHHNIHFGNSWDGVFEELIEKKQLMSDPSLLVTVPTHDDKSLAPKNRESYYVLFPTPNLSANIDWRIQAPKYRDEMVGTLEKRGYVGFGDAIEVEHLTTPLEWEEMGLAMGAPFASAHTFSQTGPFRPNNFPRAFENVVFTGSGTQPGVGVPMVIISGKLAAQRILGSNRG